MNRGRQLAALLELSINLFSRRRHSLDRDKVTNWLTSGRVFYSAPES